jgi:hypothetical protein
MRGVARSTVVLAVSTAVIVINSWIIYTSVTCNQPSLPLQASRSLMQLDFCPGNDHHACKSFRLDMGPKHASLPSPYSRSIMEVTAPTTRIREYGETAQIQVCAVYLRLRAAGYLVSYLAK